MGEAPKDQFGTYRAGDDGTREGGLVFVVTVIIGMVVATLIHPLALTSFFVWFALLMLAASIAVCVQRLTLTWFHGGAAPEAEHQQFRQRARTR